MEALGREFVVYSDGLMIIECRDIDSSTSS